MLLTIPPVTSSDVAPKVVIVIEPSERSKDVRSIKAKFHLKCKDDKNKFGCVIKKNGHIADGAFPIYGPTYTFVHNADPDKDGPTVMELYVDYMSINDTKGHPLLKWSKPLPNAMVKTRILGPFKSCTYYITISGLGKDLKDVSVTPSGGI